MGQGVAFLRYMNGSLEYFSLFTWKFFMSGGWPELTTARIFTAETETPSVSDTGVLGSCSRLKKKKSGLIFMNVMYCNSPVQLRHHWSVNSFIV